MLREADRFGAGISPGPSSTAPSNPQTRMHSLRTAIPLRIFAVAATALLVGCGDSDSPVEPGAAASGSVSFSYTGAVSGSYSASGAYRIDNNLMPVFGTFAVGGRDHHHWLYIYGFRSGTNPRGDWVGITVQNITGPRTVTYSNDFCLTRCTGIVMEFNTSVLPGEYDPDVTCALLSGTINVTALEARRVRGTFAGRGDCTNRRTGRFIGEVVVSNGTFDVPLVEGVGG